MKIKSILTVLILTASILTGEICRSQDPMDDFPRNDIQIGYGFISMLSVSTLLMNALMVAFTPLPGEKTITDVGSWGPIFVNYNFFPLKWLGVGLVVAYEADNNRTTYSNGGYSDMNWQYTTFMLKVNFRYGWEWVKFYHGISAGVTYAKVNFADTTGIASTNDGALFAFHITAFGIRVGKTVGVFADIGIGYLGIVNVGVNFVF
jgi:hypothetical protein